jgi:hypothetical protein
MIARWSIVAKFGYKQNVIDLMQRWLRDIGPKAGFGTDKARLLTGSIGALESTVQSEHEVKDLAELDQIWGRLGGIEGTIRSGARRSSRTSSRGRTGDYGHFARYLERGALQFLERFWHDG